jgi:serine protease Do
MKNLVLIKALPILTTFLLLNASAISAEPAADNHAYAKGLGSTFADISQKVSPAVVVINIWYSDEPREDASGEGGEGGAPFEFFFPQPRGGPRQPQGGGRGFDSTRPDSQGSGFIVNADGTIYTNNHVIDKADRIEVKLKDGTKVPAQVVGVDPNSDVAVLKINAKSLKTPLAVAELGDSDASRVGEWAIAIGAPFGLEYSVTVGVISAKGRTGFSMDSSKPIYEDYIQTDATINPGNSGGPLVDIEGRVIGVNTLIRTQPGIGGFYNTNTGFAIPINMAHKNAQQIIAQGRVIRPWLGVKIQGIDQVGEEVRARLVGVNSGVMIQGIDPETPASKSDLKPFDVVTEIDGAKVGTAKELQSEVLKKKVGQTVKLSVVRNGKTISVDLKTGELPSQVVQVSRPLPKDDAQPSTGYGFTVQPLTEPLARRFNLPYTGGLVISNIDPASPADSAGLLPGDVITEVDYKTIVSIPALKKALADSDPEKGILIHLIRQGTKIFTVMKKKDASVKKEASKPAARPPAQPESD